jgi:hypothetical protein
MKSVSGDARPGDIEMQGRELNNLRAQIVAHQTKLAELAGQLALLQHHLADSLEERVAERLARRFDAAVLAAVDAWMNESHVYRKAEALRRLAHAARARRGAMALNDSEVSEL